MSLTHFQIRNPNDDETPIESATQIFASILPRSHISWFTRLVKGNPDTYAFEIYLLAQTIYFYITVPSKTETYIHSLITSSFPQSIIDKTTDPLGILFKARHISIGEAVLDTHYFYPIKTYQDFAIDPLGSLLGYMAKQTPQVKLGIQMLVTQATFPWQDKAMSKMKQQPKMVTDPLTGEQKKELQPLDFNSALIAKKIGFQGGRACIRLLAASTDENIPTDPYLHNLIGTFGSFALGEGNKFTFTRPTFGRKDLLKRIQRRQANAGERKFQILNAQEMATLWHPPGQLLAGIKNMAWGRTLAGEPPDNLITSENVQPEEKKDINFFAKAEYKNSDSNFGIKTADRRKHMYIIGKTGAGKSTLIANMAIDDIRKDRGVGIIDPHGDLCDIIMDYVPKRRVNDVVYLEPFDDDRPFSLNVLEIKNPQHRDLIASGIVAIFSKLYAHSWGPRLEYILRNVIISLLELPEATLIDALSMLSNAKFRSRAVEKINDPVIKDFWTKEFDQMSDRLRTEAISPIQNKVGQFVTSKKIRNIIGNPKSSINLEEIMNNKKILILNLSQGKLGEDNAALLGAMFITQIQLAAMNRSYQKEEDRQDFFLYVDEFQNFATTSFIKILSEARKYRLALTLTNQYIDQLTEEITHSIFGNVGTLISFVVGARDATLLTKEFSGLYSDNDLVSLGMFEIVLKLSINNMTSKPFPAKTLPLPSLKNSNKEKIIRVSKEKFGRKVKQQSPPPVQEGQQEGAGEQATPVGQNARKVVQD